MNYGFIGLGNMADAIISGMVSSGDFSQDRIYGVNRGPIKAERMSSQYGLIPCKAIGDVMEYCDVIVLCVKPGVLPDIMENVSEKCLGKLIISIAAGKSIEWYEKYLPKDASFIRVMPNINAFVHESVSAVCPNKNVSEDELSIAEKIFGSVGSVYRIEEKMFPAFSSICGASGAFVLLYIDALAESGVRAGFSRKLSEEFAVKTVLGTSRLALNTDEHPIALMNKICSPGGTTIEGVIKLKEMGFESAVHKGISAIIEKDKML